MGTATLSRATELLITADGGGSNGYRSRLWKVALQDLADDIGLKLTVCHFPPGTSKWNKIEHRLFCYITQNWRGKPLVSVQVIVNLIAATRTTKGLIVKAALDEGKYETGITVTDEQMAKLNLRPARVPRRMELHYQAPSPEKLTILFLPAPLTQIGPPRRRGAMSCRSMTEAGSRRAGPMSGARSLSSLSMVSGAARGTGTG